MNAVADLLGTRLGGVNLQGIAAGIVFLTIPGLALATGLKRFRTPSGGGEGGFDGDGGGRGGQVKAHLQRAGGQLASFVTIVAVLMAGLGLVPLARAGYEVVSGGHEMAPAVIGVIGVAALLVKGWVMARDLMDGKVDRPYLWLAPAPLLALLVWVAPVVADQITDQAGRTVQMVVDQAKADVRDRDAKHPSGKDKTDTDKPDKKQDRARDGAGAGEQDR